MNNTFNITRFVKLIKFKYALNAKSLLIQVGGIAALFTIISGFVLYASQGTENAGKIDGYFLGIWIAMLFGGGLYLTSHSFSILQNTSRGFLYMQLPASTFEKLLMALLSTGIFFALMHTFLYTILANFQYMVWGWFVELPEYSFNPLNKDYFLIVKSYLYMQPVFLLGALFFRKFNFVLTNLSIFLVGFVGFWLQVLVFFIAFGTLNPNFQTSLHIENSEPDVWWLNLIGIVIALVFISASYFKLKEKEV